MGKGHCSLGRPAKIGAFVAGLMLVLALPSIALAANVATFSSATPASGSYTRSVRPTISVIVYDRYGVASTSSLRALYIGSTKYTPTMTRISGLTRFKLSYTLPPTAAALSQGSHTVKVTVKDAKAHTSTYSWTFKVDSVAPSTSLIGSFPIYDTGAFTTFVFSASDAGSGVAHTYYTINGGATVTVLPTYPVLMQDFVPGVYHIRYWSVDNVGNVEAQEPLDGTVYVLHTAIPPYDSNVSCFAAGCHGDGSGNTPSLGVIHANIPGYPDQTGCTICHGTGLPTANCTSVGCHSSQSVDATHQAFANPHAGIHSTSFVIESTTTPTACTSSGCHGTNLLFQGVATVDATNTDHTHLNCGVCHNSADPRFSDIVNTAIADDTTVTCEACHITPTTGVASGPTVTAIHNAFGAATDHAVGGACFSADCHGTDVSLTHASGPITPVPGCVACHPNSANLTTRNDGVASTNCDLCHNDITSIHNSATNTSHSSAVGTKSSACVACHGQIPVAHNGIYTGQADLGCFCHDAGPSADATLLAVVASGNAECVTCHVDGMYGAPHEFSSPTTSPLVSGHNTTTYGTIGAKSMFNGSQGVTLHWRANETSSSLTATYATALGVSSITTNQVGVINTTWATPTVGVFWAAGDPLAPSTAMTGLSWSSVITCQDCHTGLNLAGPHGANDNFGIDPNYPGGYQYAQLTKYVPEPSTPATTWLNPAWPVGSANASIALSNSGIAMFPGAATGADVTTTTVNAVPAGALKAQANRTDGTTGPTAVICAKCHKLEVWNGSSVVAANTAHSSHHQDQLDGSDQCVNCHIGVPHGWIRPRLLVNSDTDVAPYKSPYLLGTTTTKSTSPAKGFVLGNTNTASWPAAVIKPFGSGWGAGFNGEGMQYLSATDQHILVNGSVVWSAGGDSSCDACGVNSHLHEGDGVAVMKE